MENNLKIKDIYIGNLDAKDDFNLENQSFIENFILPKEFDIEEFFEGRKLFIEGLKGTGKTALLYFMKSKIDNKGLPSDIILFKSHYDEIKKKKMVINNDKIISLQNKDLINQKNFVHIWRLTIIGKILILNAESNYRVYQKSKELDELTSLIIAITKKQNKKNPFASFKSALSKTKISSKYDSMENSIEFDFDWRNAESNFELHEKIDECMKLFKIINSKKSESTAYIFIDELEAFYEDEEIFHRDLTLIRDLIFTIKEFSDITFVNNKNIKFVCAIRSEMIDAINNHISSKELNKNIYSFRHILKWNYPNVTGIKHPIFQIWLKRIYNAEKKRGQDLSDEQIFEKWFDKKINDEYVYEHIIHHTWNKPRDIIRFMQAAKNVGGENVKYNQMIFTNLKREYSKESWKEIVEELNANFSKDQIGQIRKLFVGFITKFNLKQLIDRAESQHNDYFLKNYENILQVLFRVGVLGNIGINVKGHRWNHKEDNDLLIHDSNFLIEVHFALWNELTLTKIAKHSIAYLDKGRIFKAKVDIIRKNNIEVYIEKIDVVTNINVKELDIDITKKPLYKHFVEGQDIYVKVYKDRTFNTNRLRILNPDELKEYLNKEEKMLRLREMYGEEHKYNK